MKKFDFELQRFAVYDNYTKNTVINGSAYNDSL